MSHPSFRQCSLDNDWEAGLGGLGSLDSSDLILASQGSLAGLELLAMRGSMRPNGSISNSVYVNPFNPLSRNTSRGHKKHRQKLASRSRSNDLGSDLEFGSSVDNLELHHRFRKSRQHQLESLPRSDSMTLGDRSQESSNNQNKQRLKKSSQKSIVGALNQGLVSLGEKLGVGGDVSLSQSRLGSRESEVSELECLVSDNNENNNVCENYKSDHIHHPDDPDHLAVTEDHGDRRKDDSGCGTASLEILSAWCHTPATDPSLDSLNLVRGAETS